MMGGQVSWHGLGFLALFFPQQLLRSGLCKLTMHAQSHFGLMISWKVEAFLSAHYAANETREVPTMWGLI